MFKWVIEVKVDETWVADGFNFDEARCQAMEETLLPWAYAGEVKVRVIKAPDQAKIRRAQGYEEGE